LLSSQRRGYNLGHADRLQSLYFHPDFALAISLPGVVADSGAASSDAWITGDAAGSKRDDNGFPITFLNTHHDADQARPD
jgi:hypothetical protein